MLSRRELLSSATAAAFAYSIVPSFAAETDPAAQLNALMETFFRENLNENPEGATQLGFDKGENAGLKSRLRDETLAVLRDAGAEPPAKLPEAVAAPVALADAIAWVSGRPADEVAVRPGAGRFISDA